MANPQNRPNFAVAADETSYRRLGAVIREEIYRLISSAYSFGVQSETGVVRLDQAQSALNAARDRIYSKIEALLMTLDMLAEIKDVDIVQEAEGHAFKAVRKSRAKPKVAAPKPVPEPPIISIEDDPVVDQEAQDLVERVLAGIEAGE